MPVPSRGQPLDVGWSGRPGTASTDLLLGRVRRLASAGVVLVLEGDTDGALFTGLLGDDGPALVSAGDGLLLWLLPTPCLKTLDLMLMSPSSSTLTSTGFCRLAVFGDQIQVVFTDAHDMETMIISAEAVRRCVLTTLLRCGLIESLDVWRQALEYQIELSLLRLVVHCENWAVNLEGIPPSKVYGPDGSVNRGPFVAEILPRLRSSGVDIGPGDLMQLVASYDQSVLIGHRS